jgi:hypothetical protein
MSRRSLSVGRVLPVWCLCCGLLGLRDSTAVRAETIDRVLAVAAGHVIMLSDVTAALEFGWVTPEDSSDPIRQVLTKLIDRELVLAEVERYAPPEPSDEAVDREVATVRARFPTTSAYDAALARTGIDEKHVRDTLRQNLRVRAYEDQRFTPANARRQALIDEWVAGLRRRGDFVNLYGAGQ